MYHFCSVLVGAFAPTSLDELLVWNFFSGALFFGAALYKAPRATPAITGHALKGYLWSHALAGVTAATYLLLTLTFLHPPLAVVLSSNPLYLGLAGFGGLANAVVVLRE